ncbi:MAG: HAD-IA family hydrolase [Bacilli bacterium]|nr:HAD-IA family hydrolase [Bacilli bacterium]
MKRLILTDCFGVILNEIAPYWFQEHFTNPEEAKVLKDKYFVPFDLGEIGFDEVMEKMAQELGFDAEVLKEFWKNGVVIDHELLAYYDSLREKGDYIALASNAGTPFLDDILDSHDLRKHFDEIFISSHLHIVKPDLRFYETCLSDFPMPYSQVIMIDDQTRNLEGLEKLGIQPILYRGIEDLKVKLEEK